MAKIKASTLARNPQTGEVEFLAEGSTAPAWAAKVITNPDVLDQPKTSGRRAAGDSSGEGSGEGDKTDPPAGEGDDSK